MTPSGMVMEVSEVAPSKAPYPIEISWLLPAKVMEVSEVAPESA